MVAEIARHIGVRRPIVSVLFVLGYLTGKVLGTFVDDVMITREEIEGLMSGLLYVKAPPAGTTRLSEWLGQNADTLGRRYTSELARRRDRQGAYRSN